MTTLKKKGVASAAPAPTAAAPKAAPVKAKTKPAEKSPLSAAQRVAAKLNANKKLNYQAEVVFDPEAPAASANTWASMPYPWNKLTGVPGLAFGQILTIQGKPDSGKTTLAMHGMVESQAQGFNVALIDTEHKFNLRRLHDMGFKTNDLVHIKCESIEDGFDAIETTLTEFEKEAPGVPTLFVWDSLGQTPTDEELKGTSRSFTVASAAKVIKKNLRRLRSRLAKTETCVVFVNQVYDNINALFGNSTKGYGGNGAYYASSIVIEVQRIRNKTKKQGDKQIVIGLVSGMKCTKNHMSDVQGAKFEVIIGPKGIEQGSTREIDTEDLQALAESEPVRAKVSGNIGGVKVVDDREGAQPEGDDDGVDMLNPPPKMKNGRVASL